LILCGREVHDSFVTKAPTRLFVDERCKTKNGLHTIDNNKRWQETEDKQRRRHIATLLWISLGKFNTTIGDI
jgi:hypothetical protein